MDRRDALKGLVATASGLLLPKAALATPTVTQNSEKRRNLGNRYGWTPNKASLEDFIRRHSNPYVSQQNKEIKGDGTGKIVMLHKALERVSGRKYEPHDQEGPDCVSHGFALGVDILSAVQIALKRFPQRWAGFAATEPIYGGSRVEIGGYTGRGGGSTGHWGAEWISRYGILLRQKYPGGYDFTRYDWPKAYEYGRQGCPDPLEPTTKLHPVKTVALCKSYQECIDCIANGMPVVVCSNVGFGDGKCKRDSDGFLTRKRAPWWHCMLFGGFDDSYRRPGCVCFNSWGYDWVYGPTRHDQPSGTFWVDAETVDAMLRQGDSFALSAYMGYPRLNIPPYVLY
jgi:hypothetical protein